MTENLNELRRIAEAEETQKWGSWAFEEDDFDGFCIYINDGDNFGRSYVAKDLTQGESEGESTARFITTFDPPTVLALIDRVEAAEQAVDFHAQRDSELKTLLSMIADRLDEFCYDELSSLIEDGPLDQWGETYKSKLQTAEQAVERAKAVDALQRRDKVALYRRAEVAEGRLSAVGLVIDDLHATGAISQDAADQLTAALEGKNTP